MRTRRFTRSDIEKILKLAKEAYAEMKTTLPLSLKQIERVLNHNLNNALFFGSVLEDKEEIIGFGIGRMKKQPWSDEGICILDMLFIPKDIRTKITVDYLVTAFRDWARHRGVKEVEVNNCCMPEFKLNSDYSVERMEL